MSLPVIFSEHPVSEAMRATVLQCLENIERRFNVKVLFAAESGSRGWGFASPDSDYDVRFIYVNRLRWYLTVATGRDVIEQPISGELDVSGWDLRKALALMHKSNPVLLEWLRSPIIYRQDDHVAAQLCRLAAEQLSLERAYHHYLSMAQSNTRGYLQGDMVRYKKYLYVLRPLLATRWIRQGLGAPPMRFAELAQGTLDDVQLLEEINRLLAVKMQASEADTSPPWPVLHRFIEEELVLADAQRPPVAAAPPMAPLDEMLFQCAKAFDE
jgi:uncharacterized protein